MKKIEEQELKELIKLKATIEQKDLQLQNMHLQLENTRLQYKNLLLNLKMKYQIANDSQIELETGNIIETELESKEEHNE
jgi:hypothetical protein